MTLQSATRRHNRDQTICLLKGIKTGSNGIFLDIGPKRLTACRLTTDYDGRL